MRMKEISVNNQKCSNNCMISIIEYTEGSKNCTIPVVIEIKIELTVFNLCNKDKDKRKRKKKENGECQYYKYMFKVILRIIAIKSPQCNIAYDKTRYFFVSIICSGDIGDGLRDKCQEYNVNISNY